MNYTGNNYKKVAGVFWPGEDGAVVAVGNASGVSEMREYNDEGGHWIRCYKDGVAVSAFNAKYVDIIKYIEEDKDEIPNIR